MKTSKSFRGIAWWVGAAAATTLGVVACGSDFSADDCKASRTCKGEPGGAAGERPDEGGAGAGTGLGGEDNASVGGNAGAGGAEVAVGANGGEGGAAPILVGTPCSKDADCDDGDSCSGVETCVDGTCAAGQPVECPAGLVCSAANHNACVFASHAPWIVYTTADKKGVIEAYGIKVDLLDTMTPVKLSPALDAGWSVYTVRDWSPNGTAVVVTLKEQTSSRLESYLVRFGNGLPDAAIQLTKGLPASKTSRVEWSPTGKLLAISRDDALYAVDFSSDGTVTQSRVSPETYDQVVGWIKNDNEVVYVARNTAAKMSAALAVRNGGGWTRHPLVPDMGTLLFAIPTADRGTLGYETTDANLRTLSIVETTDGSQATAITDPSTDIALYASPDVSHYLLATTETVNYKTTVFGGPLASLSARPVLKQALTLPASAALGVAADGPWAPDSSRAAVFQDGVFGKQLVMYQPGAAEEWHALPETQALQGDLAPLWSPDSKALALPTRTSASSNLVLTLVASPDYTKRELDTVPSAGGYVMGPFSPGGGIFVYAKTSTGGAATDGYYVDLRKGVADAPEPIALPGALGSRDFANNGTDFVYLRDAQHCFYIDFSGKTASEPVQVNPAGTATSCSFQKLPR